MMQGSLDDIGLFHGTDKASNGHNYLQFYERFFSYRRNQRLKILEVGIFGGSSLKTWREYFHLSQIVGVDINPSMRKFVEDRVCVEIADQSDLEEMLRVAVKHGPFDIIIEDGSHFWEHQITTLRSLFPFVKDGGLYIVEDLHTNFGVDKEAFRGVASFSCADYLKRWADLCCADKSIDISIVEDSFLRTYGRAAAHITFAKQCCLIEKRYNHRDRVVELGTPILEKTSQGSAFLMAHVAGVGDVYSDKGFVNLPGAVHYIQGFSLKLTTPIEYRVIDQEKNWSPWARNGEFLGSRGRGVALTGLQIRPLEDPNANNVRVACRFSHIEQAVQIVIGEEYISPNDAFLCGIHAIDACDVTVSNLGPSQ